MPRLRRSPHGLTYALLAVWVLCAVLQFVSGWSFYAADQTHQGDTPTWWGASGYLMWNLWTWMGNSTAEVIPGVLGLVILTKWLRERGSNEDAS
jgi:hypothetical protein